jgi:hypothetical protein
MANKNTLENKRARKEIKVYDKHYPDYWVHIKQILTEDEINNKCIPQVKVVSQDKALRLTKGFIKMGDQIFQLTPQWERYYA